MQVQPGIPDRPDYGLDAPGVVRGSAGAGIALLCLAAGVRRWRSPVRRVATPAAWTGAALLGSAAVHWAASRHGKTRLAHQLLDRHHWSGREEVLDVGCGRGLLLLAAAKRAHAGRAVGIDIWSQVDQGDNRPDATLANARAAGVDGRVSVATADAAALPFPDASFDVVTSSFALHNLRDARLRRQAVAELARVVRPSGRILVVDLFRVREYADALEEEGFGVERSRVALLGFLPVGTVDARRSPTLELSAPVAVVGRTGRAGARRGGG